MLPVRGSAEQDQWVLGSLDQHGGVLEHSVAGDGIEPRVWRNDRGVCQFCRDVLGQLQQHSARSFLFGDPERLANDRRDGVGIDDLLGNLADRTEQLDHIDDLKLALLGLLDRLLSGDHDQREGPQMGVSRGRCEIRRPWPQGCHADAGPTGQAAIGGGHEAGTLFMARQDQPDLRLADRLEHVQVFFAWHGEYVFDALVDQRFDEEVRALPGFLFDRHVVSSRFGEWVWSAVASVRPVSAAQASRISRSSALVWRRRSAMASASVLTMLARVFSSSAMISSKAWRSMQISSVSAMACTLAE